MEPRAIIEVDPWCSGLVLSKDCLPLTHVKIFTWKWGNYRSWSWVQWTVVSKDCVPLPQVKLIGATHPLQIVFPGAIVQYLTSYSKKKFKYWAIGILGSLILFNKYLKFTLIKKEIKKKIALKLFSCLLISTGLVIANTWNIT